MVGSTFILALALRALRSGSAGIAATAIRATRVKRKPKQNQPTTDLLFENATAAVKTAITAAAIKISEYEIAKNDGPVSIDEYPVQAARLHTSMLNGQYWPIIGLAAPPN